MAHATGLSPGISCPFSVLVEFQLFAATLPYGFDSVGNPCIISKTAFRIYAALYLIIRGKTRLVCRRRAYRILDESGGDPDQLPRPITMRRMATVGQLYDFGLHDPPGYATYLLKGTIFVVESSQREYGAANAR